MRNSGFSLIELIVAIAIIAVLSGLAYPAYTAHIRTARRADAQAALMGLAQAMERDYTIKGTYRCSDSVDYSKTDYSTCTDDSNASPGNYPAQSPLDGSVKFYNLSIVSADATSYLLRATPMGAQSSDGLLEISSTGAKGWDKNGDGDTGDAGESCWEKSC